MFDIQLLFILHCNDHPNPKYPNSSYHCNRIIKINTYSKIKIKIWSRTNSKLGSRFQSAFMKQPIILWMHMHDCNHASSTQVAWNWFSTTEQSRGWIIKSIYNLVSHCVLCNSSHNVVNNAIGIIEAFSNVNIVAKCLQSYKRSRALVGALTMVLVVL